nr:ATP-binding cassette sub-family A member like [Tanacetum cinerariifolium]
MDKEQAEMQNVGFFGLFKESIKTIFSWKKIFTQITLTFILPLSFIFLAHIIIADMLGLRIRHSEYSDNSEGHYYYRRATSEWLAYWIFKFVYLSFLFLFSLLSTAAIVYTIATIYTGGDVTFKKVLKVVPRVWKRLALTFLWIYLGFFVYNVVSGVVAFIWSTTIADTTYGTIMFWVCLCLYLIGFVYLTAIWQLASVVTVLESDYGLKAMTKGHELIKGKRWLSWFVFFALYCVFGGILMLFYVFAWSYTILIVGPVCLFLLMNMFLVGFVAQTMLYLVCKSHHHEPIDKLGLSTQLGGYLGQFEPVFKALRPLGIIGNARGVLILLYKSKIITPSMVAKYIISAIKELSNKEPLMPLLVSFDPEDVRRNAATST